MIDNMSMEQRSVLMSKVKGWDTDVEVVLRRLLWKEGFRYRKNHKTEGVRVDLVIPGFRMAIFIDGCFWHGCPLHYTIPGTREEFWQTKLRTNVERDRRQTLTLEQNGWKVVRIWEHEVEEDPIKVANKICRNLRSGRRPRKRNDWRVVRAENNSKLPGKIFFLQNLHDESIEKREFVVRSVSRTR